MFWCCDVFRVVVLFVWYIVKYQILNNNSLDTLFEVEVEVEVQVEVEVEVVVVTPVFAKIEFPRLSSLLK